MYIMYKSSQAHCQVLSLVQELVIVCPVFVFILDFLGLLDDAKLKTFSQGVGVASAMHNTYVRVRNMYLVFDV